MKNAISSMVMIGLAAIGAGCQTPCGDHETTTLPASFENAPIVLQDAAVCNAHAESATVMYWGDEVRLHDVMVLTTKQMVDAGYHEEPTGDFNPETPTVAFSKGDAMIELHFRPTESPRFGAKLWAPSILIMASRETKASL